MFHSHDGLIEMREFSDFYKWAMLNPQKIRCPECGMPMTNHIYTGFQMNKRGMAILTCNDPKCHFHKNEIKIETVWREKDELARLY